MVKIVSSEAGSSETGYRMGDMFRAVLTSGKQALEFLDENDIKLMLKVRNEPAAQVEVEDNATTVALNVIDPELIGSLWRILLSRSD